MKRRKNSAFKDGSQRWLFMASSIRPIMKIQHQWKLSHWGSAALGMATGTVFLPALSRPSFASDKAHFLYSL